MNAYSNDLRAKIAAAYEANNYSMREIAQLFAVSISTVKLIVQRKRRSGSTDALPHNAGRRLRADQQAQEFLRTRIAEQNDLTLQELCTELHQHSGLRLSPPTMCRLLQRLKLPRKKKSSGQ